MLECEKQHLNRCFCERVFKATAQIHVVGKLNYKKKKKKCYWLKVLSPWQLKLSLCSDSFTFFIEVEVLQALVHVAGRRCRSDVGVGVDWAQARDGRTVPHWCQVARFWTVNERQGHTSAWTNPKPSQTRQPTDTWRSLRWPSSYLQCLLVMAQSSSSPPLWTAGQPCRSCFHTGPPGDSVLPPAPVTHQGRGERREVSEVSQIHVMMEWSVL